MILILLLVVIFIIVSFSSNYQHMNNTKSLKFIHIPKNAGTSIENLGNKYGYKWGRFDNITVYKNSPCDYYIWHSPYINKKPGYEYFAIIRNPYDKIISEFYYVNTGKIKKGEFGNKKHIDIFYDWFNKIYNLYKTNKYWNNCHILPQSYYTMNNNIEHIIYLDKDFKKNLNVLFNEKFNLNINVDDLEKENSTKKEFNKEDLNKNTLDKIYEMYSSDFETFNFTKI